MIVKILKYLLILIIFVLSTQNLPTAENIKLEYVGADSIFDDILEHTYHISKLQITNKNTKSEFFYGHSDSSISFKTQSLGDSGWVYNNKVQCGFGVYLRELPPSKSMVFEYFESENDVQRIEISFYDKQKNLLFKKYSEPLYIRGSFYNKKLIINQEIRKTS